MRCVFAVLGVALLLVAGCAAEPSPLARSSDPPARPSSTASASASSVRWMEDFCTVAGDLRTALWGSAADPGSGDPGALRKVFDATLSNAVEALGAAMDRLDGLPSGAPPGAPEAVTELDDQLSALRELALTGQESLAALPPNATESEVGRVMGTTWPKVASRAAKPLDGVPLTNDMKAAATGPTCRALPGLR